MFRNRRSSFGSRIVAGALGSLSASLQDCVQAWWNKDRVRVSPREGRLLRLAAGSILFIERETYQVLGRDTIATKYGPVIRYRCATADTERELWVVATPIPTILLVEDHHERELSRDDVEIWR